MSELEVGSIKIKAELDPKEFDEGTKKMENGLSKLGGVVKAVFAGIIIKQVVDGIKQIVNAYGEFEQLVGGVETLFKDSADTVRQYADQAYKTAGISANKYMETVTSFSASLLQSLDGDTAKAAEVADMAIRDMSDNANKMGTSMEAIQSAYQGFAKQNYTMLDNLKLGYGGTRTEMERLLADAEKISGIHYDIENLNDVYQAIHVIQTELDITGTTAKEASTTLEGSANSMKASFENLKVAIAGGGDLPKAVSEFVSTILTYMKNLIPRVGEILKNVPKLLSEMISSIPEILGELAPMIMDIFESLPSIILDFFKNSAPAFVESMAELMMGMANGLIEAIPLFIGMLPQLVYAIVNFLLGNIELMINTGIQLITSLVTALPQIIQAIVAVLPTLISAIVLGLLDHIPDIVMAGVELLIAIVENLPTIIIEIVKAIPKIIVALVQKLAEMQARMREAGKELFLSIVARVKETYAESMQKTKELVDKIKEAIKQKISDIMQAGKDLVTGLWNGIKGGWDWLIQSVKNLANKLIGSVKNVLGIHSPSTIFEGIGENLAEGLDIGYTVEWSEFEGHALGAFKDMINEMSGMDIMGKDIGYGLGQTLTAEALEPVTTQVVLDGRVIAESTNAYNRNLTLAVGMR